MMGVFRGHSVALTDAKFFQSRRCTSRCRYTSGMAGLFLENENSNTIVVSTGKAREMRLRGLANDHAEGTWSPDGDW